MLPMESNGGMASYLIDWQDMPPLDCRASVVTIGNFDGVHVGHAALVTETCRQAHELAVPGVVLTFDPRPVELLRPEHAMPRLTTTEDRCRLLHERGADHVLILRTTAALLNLTAAEFFHQVIV